MASDRASTPQPAATDRATAAAVAALRHPLRDRLQPSPSPEHTAHTLGNVLPLRQLEALTPPTDWWHQDGHIPLPTIPMAAWLGSPVLLDIDGRPHHWLLLHHDGHATLQQDRHQIRLAPGDGFLLPGRSFRLTTHTNSATALPIDPQHLLSTAAAMGPPGWYAPANALPLQQPRTLTTPGDGHAPLLLEALHHLLPSLAQLAPLPPRLLLSLEPSQTVLRVLAALVFPELRPGHRASPPPLATPGRRHRGDQRLDPLLTFIQAHLEEALPLPVLERVSNYSRRTLHYAFQERFGCTPLQWIRQQRLTKAHQRLLHPQGGDSVTAIALACGYRSLGRFNVDYQRAYGAKPSVVLRQGALPPGARPTPLNGGEPSGSADGASG